MSSKQHVLIVDDEPDICELLEITLGRMNLETRSAKTVTRAKELLAANKFHLCLTDMRLPDGNGLELIEHIQQEYSQVPVAMISAFGSIDTAIAALKAGAFDFISKPISIKGLRDLVSTALKLDEPAEEASQSKESSPLLGKSPAMEVLRAQINKLARSQAPVYISGQSGSGKELVARLIHQLGPRNDKPFIPVNCGAIPSELMESEFFGHKKGSFTGAREDKQGLFQAAHGGTLFLDEVADLPLAMQVKLLRAIQEKAIRAVGAQHETAIDVRILSATHKNLQKAVDDNIFRQDLFYRINVIELKVPNLSERREDIGLLTTHILKRLSKDMQTPNIEITGDALLALENYHFPGNVRELENILERAFTLCEDAKITRDDLHLSSSRPQQTETIANQQPSQQSAMSVDPGSEEIQLPADSSLEEYLESIEIKAIKQALEKTRWNKTAAAKELGMSFRALRYRLKKLSLD